METSTIWSTDVHAFRREVDRISEDVRAEALEMAAAKYPMLAALNTCNINQNESSDTFEIKERLALMVGKATGMACDANKRTVHTNTGRMYPVQSWKPYADIELCMMTCKTEASLRETVLMQESAAIKVLLADLMKLMWHGNESKGIYGLLNHPESMLNTTNAGAKWATATDNAIALELISAMDGMSEPRVLSASNLYRTALAVSDRSKTSGCSMKIDCITRLIEAQPDITGWDGEFTPIKDLNADGLHGDLVIVYDNDAVCMTMSDISYLASTTEGQTNILGRRMLNTFGLKVDYDGAMHTIYHAGDEIAEG